MKSRESESELAVFDSLIDGLADHAGSSEATSSSFFAKSGQIIDAIFAPKWSAVLTQGCEGSPVLVHASGATTEHLGKLIAGSAGTSSRFQSSRFESLLNRSAELSNSGVVVCPIGRRSGEQLANDGGDQFWGCYVVDLGSAPVESVQSDVIGAIAETAGEFILNQERKRSPELEQFESDVAKFSVNAHSSLDPRVVGHHLANDARLLFGCERVSVFMLNRRSPKLLAISSVASVEERSQLIKQMKSFVGRAVRLGEPIISDQPSLDQRQAGLVEAHCESTGLPFMFGVPVHRRTDNEEKRGSHVVGFVLAESTRDIDRVKFARGLNYVLPHAATSLSNANSYSQIPFRRSLGWMGRMSSFANLTRFGAIVGLGAILIAASLLLTTDFKVRIPGELRPVVDRNVFSSHDGVIGEVFADYGDQVEVNQPLMQLRSAKFEVELEKASSDILKLQQFKEAKQVSLNRVSDIGSDQNLAAQLASEISDLDFQMATLKEKEKFLKQQVSELLILSPIDGQVTTWEARENLTARPVRWGDPVLNVAQLDGDWNVIFRVPERRIGYILARDQEREPDESLELEFFLESDPGTKYLVPVTAIDRSAIVDPELGPVTILKCELPVELKNKRQGATVSGDVDCGRKSIWFVWTREMFDAMRRRFVW